MESRWLSDSTSQLQVDRPIYVAGLARSGSTILLECLAANPDVASHQYRDFPCLHVPYWWNWFLDHASSKAGEPVERAHKDRIRVSPESPEAMEELLWMSFFPDAHDPSRSQVLTAVDSNSDFEDFYTDHIRKLLLARGRKRYVAKGNYNVSRLEYLLRLFPQARFIVPVRDPVSHIASLMKQHRLFCDAERRDPKVLSYMQRAGHFEFGLDRRLINLGCGETVPKVEQLWKEGDEIRGWAVYWASLYAFVARQLRENNALAQATRVVHYSELCAAPASVLQSIYEHCELASDSDLVRRQAEPISAPTYYQPEFSQDELAMIRGETSGVVEQLRSLAGTCC